MKIQINIVIENFFYLPDVFPLPLQNHFLVELHITTQFGSWIPQYLQIYKLFVDCLSKYKKKHYPKQQLISKLSYDSIKNRANIVITGKHIQEDLLCKKRLRLHLLQIVDQQHLVLRHEYFPAIHLIPLQLLHLESKRQTTFQLAF